MSVNDSNYNIWFPCVEGAWQFLKILRKKIPYICLLILNVTPANKYSMPYLTKKIAQLMKHLFLTSISSCCLQFSSLFLPAMFVDLIMLEWSARRQRPEQKNCMQKIYNLCVWHRHIRKTRIIRKYQMLRRIPFLHLLLNLAKQTIVLRS